MQTDILVRRAVIQITHEGTLDQLLFGIRRHEFTREWKTAVADSQSHVIPAAVKHPAFLDRDFVVAGGLTHVPLNLAFPVFMHGAGNPDAQPSEKNVICLWPCSRIINLVLKLYARTDFEKLVAIAEFIAARVSR